MSLGIYVFVEIEDEGGIDKKMALNLLYTAALFALFSLIPAKGFVINSDYSRLIEPVPMIMSDHYTVDEILKEFPDAGQFYVK